jgi:hypothetical protein
MSEVGLASAIGVHFAAGRINGDIPETGAGGRDLGWKLVKCAAVISVATAVLEAAEVRIVHQADIAELGAFDHDKVVFVEVLALVYEFHE